jgi:bisphosphoglycerate-independent phosphoglycerate mutase (AlkP superfamily)
MYNCCQKGGYDVIILAKTMVMQTMPLMKTNSPNTAQSLNPVPVSVTDRKDCKINEVVLLILLHLTFIMD